jgi:hypothetical protein
MEPMDLMRKFHFLHRQLSSYENKLIDANTLAQMNQTYQQCTQYIQQQNWNGVCNEFMERKYLMKY